MSFMVHMCKLISQSFFSVFQSVGFLSYQGGERAKNVPKLTNFSLSCSESQELSI